ncbi:MAG: hypothetical protein V7L12_27475 [Nostoc sp.]
MNTLVGIGAKKILVFNLSDLGQVPAATIDDRNPATLSESTSEFNLGLRTNCGRFESKPKSQHHLY